jgi:hypothetical protein
MSSPYLALGPVQFADFELPANVSWGGAQSLAVHKLPGGGRVIDAMGRDDAPINWSGIFTGQDAVARAHALDLMRVEGSIWPLTWLDFTYSVLISRFEANFHRANWIPYRITCVVLRDEAGAAAETLLSAAQTALQDTATAAALSATTAIAPVDSFASGAADLSFAAALAATAAQQATASFYLARAARNVLLG